LHWPGYSKGSRCNQVNHLSNRGSRIILLNFLILSTNNTAARFD
jgi:hypothetical protein